MIWNEPTIEPVDSQDFGRLLIQHQRRIYGFIRSLVPNQADAEDLLQETASVLWQKFPEFQPGSNFLAWAFSVARYQVMNFVKNAKRDPLRFSEEFVEAVSVDTMAQSARLERLEEILAGCWAKLRAEDQRLMAARHYEEATAKTLAERLGRPLKTIYGTLNRIRRDLIECAQRTLSKEERL